MLRRFLTAAILTCAVMFAGSAIACDPWDPDDDHGDNPLFLCPAPMPQPDDDD